MKIIYIDCYFGISGDMFVSALFDLGIDFSPLKKIFKKVGVDFDLCFSIDKRGSIAGKLMSLSWDKGQPLRSLKDMLNILDKMDLDNQVREKSKKAILKLGQVEAGIHDINIDQVHFHELGAIDTLWDIVASFWGLHKLDIERAEASSIPWFRGEIVTEHGRLPLPAPATSFLLKNKPVFPTDYDYEIVTPTGALILDQIVDGFKKGPEGIIKDVGIGYGNIKREHFNGLRLFLVEEEREILGLDEDEIYVLESNIDHLTGEELGDFFNEILASGALDVIYLPGIMKKNRPGGLLQVLCDINRLQEVQYTFFKYSLTLGIRVSKLKRKKLKRRVGEIHLLGERIRTKQFCFNGKEFERLEFEDLKKLSQRLEMSPVEIRLKKK